MSRKNLPQPQEVPTLACVFSPMRLQSMKVTGSLGATLRKMEFLHTWGHVHRDQTRSINQSGACLSWLEGLPASGTKALLLSCFVHTALFKGPWIFGCQARRRSRSSLVVPGPQESEITWEPWRVRDCTTLPSPGSKVHSGWPGRHPAQKT